MSAPDVDRPATSGSAATGAAISFIVPVKNDADGLRRCLTSIARALGDRRAEVIVVDNGSVDGSPAEAETLGARVMRVRGRVARLRNIGADAAVAPVLAFVDADHEIDPHWVEAAMESVANPVVGAVGAPYCPPVRVSWVQRSYDLLRDHFEGVRDTAWLGSGNLVVTRAAFVAAGRFDEQLETCEDVDLCQRIRTAGFRVLHDSRLRSTHHGDPASLARLFTSELWRGRDNIRVSLRHPSLRELPSAATPIVHLVAPVAASAALLLGGWRAVPVALALIAVAAVPSLFRAARMVSRMSARTAVAIAQASCVAIVYDAARALALVVRVRHRRATGPLASER